MKAMNWKKISSVQVLSHPRIHLVEDTVELPDGKVTKYIRHSLATTFSVAVIAINSKEEILLQKEYSYPPNKIMWQLPGGQAHEGEDAITAANRELSEESGFIGKHCQEIGSYYMDNRRSDMKQRVVLCTELEEKQGKQDEEEFIETYWVPVSSLKQMIASGEFCHMGLLAALNIYFSQIEQEMYGA